MAIDTDRKDTDNMNPIYAIDFKEVLSSKHRLFSMEEDFSKERQENMDVH